MPRPVLARRGRCSRCAGRLGLDPAVGTQAASPAPAPRSAAGDGRERVHAVGAAACASCHRDEHEAWTRGRHSRMIQPARAATALGDFSQTRLTLHGKPYRLRVAERRALHHRVVAHRQARRAPRRVHARQPPHSALPDHHRPRAHRRAAADLGRAAAGVVRQRRHHPARRAGHATRCSSGTRTASAATSASRTTTTRRPRRPTHDVGGFRHLVRAVSWPGQRARRPRSRAADAPAATDGDRPSSGPRGSTPATSSMVCAQCHSLRDAVAPGFRAGEDYYDYFVPKLEYTPRKEQDPVYWADGRPRRFSNDAIGLWQSRCFLKGGAHVRHVPRPAPARRRSAPGAGAGEQRAVHAVSRGHRRGADARTRGTRRPAPAAPASSATCRAPSSASRRRFAITR